MAIVRFYAFLILSVSLFFHSNSALAIRIDAQAKSEYTNVVDVFSVEDMRNTIQKIWNHGLNPKTYWTDSMEKTYQSGRSSADLKLMANQNFVRLLQDISTGALDPEEINDDIKMKSKGFLNPTQLQALITSTGRQAEVLVENIAPRNPPYMALKAALVRVYPACKYNTWVPLTKTKKILKAGVRDAAVIPLKKRFSFLGYQISNVTSDVVDADFVNAVNDIEWNMHLTPDGQLSPDGKVWKFLNVSCMGRVHQLQADMEKTRWFPQTFEDRFIMINTAFTYFIMIDRSNGQTVVNSFRTINGRNERKTPTMQDRIVRVIFNPFWVVPPTIFMEDKVQEIRTLPRGRIREYFDEHNYEVWNSAFTKQLDPESINWWSMDPDLDKKMYIRQKPHYWNALGVVKFELTNSFSIYLHDTNQRELFTDPMRLLSSGCIRLERPLELAEYLLQGTQWNRGAIENVVAKPGQVLSKSTEVSLKNPMPVYTMFLTSQLTSDNILRFTTDIYNQNQEILAKFKSAL
jgi:murein L,D-transpeptidase YcbB/YkuD